MRKIALVYEYYQEYDNEDEPTGKWEYEVEVTKEDLERYFKQPINDKLLQFINFDDLEENEDFIDFLHDRYEEEGMNDLNEWANRYNV